MKRILLLWFCVLVCLSSYAQKKKKSEPEKEPAPVTMLPEENGSVSYTEVIKVDSATKDQLYLAARKWFADNYKSANDVIQMDDKEAGEIIGKGLFYENLSFGVLVGAEKVAVYHTVKISVKDGRYKYTITGLRGNYHSSGSRIGTTYIPGNEVNFDIDNTPVKFNKKNEEKFKAAVHAHVLSTIETIKSYMIKAPVKNDDW